MSNVPSDQPPPRPTPPAQPPPSRAPAPGNRPAAGPPATGPAATGPAAGPAAAGPAAAGPAAAGPPTATAVAPPPPDRPAGGPPPPLYPPPLHGPWLSPTPWAKRWPGASRPANAGTVVAIAAAAVVAAVSLPLDRAGVGWLVTAVAGAVALAVVRAAGGRPLPGAPPALVVRRAPRPAADRYAWAAATVVLLGVGTFRAAGWLFLLCLVTATLTGTLALAGGHSLRSIAAGYTMPPIAAFRALPWLARGTARLKRPLGAATNIRVMATIATSVALLTVFGALFASADAAFAEALSRIAPDIGVASTVRWIFVFVVATMTLGGAAFLRAGSPDMSGLDATEGRKVNRFEWAVPLGLLVLLFAGFVAVQLTGLFGGNRHVLETDGLTYAEYARGGFWQLSFVTGLTLVVLAGAARWAPRAQPADRVLIRVILGALAGLTLVIVGSALHRMNLYADTYGLTRLRLLVACCEAWFGLVLLLVLVAGIRIRAPWLPRVAIAAGVLALLGLAAANPDRLIAAYNIKQDRTVDLIYLGNLSPDAVPAFAGLDRERRDCLLTRMALRLDQNPDDWRGWNLGRHQARAVIKRDLSAPSWRCS